MRVSKRFSTPVQIVSLDAEDFNQLVQGKVVRKHDGVEIALKDIGFLHMTAAIRKAIELSDLDAYHGNAAQSPTRQQ